MLNLLLHGFSQNSVNDINHFRILSSAERILYISDTQTISEIPRSIHEIRLLVIRRLRNQIEYDLIHRGDNFLCGRLSAPMQLIQHVIAHQKPVIYTDNAAILIRIADGLIAQLSFQVQHEETPPTGFPVFYFITAFLPSYIHKKSGEQQNRFSRSGLSQNKHMCRTSCITDIPVPVFSENDSLWVLLQKLLRRLWMVKLLLSAP